MDLTRLLNSRDVSVRMCDSLPWTKASPVDYNRCPERGQGLQCIFSNGIHNISEVIARPHGQMAFKGTGNKCIISHGLMFRFLLHLLPTLQSKFTYKKYPVYMYTSTCIYIHASAYMYKQAIRTCTFTNVQCFIWICAFCIIQSRIPRSEMDADGCGHWIDSTACHAQ